MFFEKYCQPACFFAARFTLRPPKTPVRNATNLRTFCLSDYLSLCLSRVSLSCDTRSVDLCILFKFIFYTSNTFRPILARFSHILVYTNFFLMYITSQNIFLIPDDSVARNLIIILISAVKDLI